MIIDTDQVVRRVLAEAMSDATRMHYLKRAAEFEAARHRPGIDYPGRASQLELRRRWRDLTETAKACRKRATLGNYEDVPELIAAVLEGVA